MKGMAAQHDNYVAMDLDKPRVDFVQVARGLGLTAFNKSLPPDVAAAIPGGLSALAPKVVDALPDATRDVVLHAYYLGFTPVYWFAGAVYLLTVVLTMRMVPPSIASSSSAELSPAKITRVITPMIETCSSVPLRSTSV